MSERRRFTYIWLSGFFAGTAVMCVLNLMLKFLG
jgi:hypothetical protein